MVNFLYVFSNDAYLTSLIIRRVVWPWLCGALGAPHGVERFLDVCVPKVRYFSSYVKRSLI